MALQLRRRNVLLLLCGLILTAIIMWSAGRHDTPPVAPASLGLPCFESEADVDTLPSLDVRPGTSAPTRPQTSAPTLPASKAPATTLPPTTLPATTLPATKVLVGSATPASASPTPPPLTPREQPTTQPTTKQQTQHGPTQAPPAARRQCIVPPPPAGKTFRNFSDHAVVTVVKNEPVFLHMWFRHYRQHFPAENMFVINNGGNDTIPDAYRGATMVTCTCERFFDHDCIIDIVTAVHRQLHERFHYVVFGDVDELVYAKGGLWSYLNQQTEPVIKVTSITLFHRRQQEPVVDWDRNILAQRRFAFRDDLYDKPLITRVGTRWANGFHQCNAPRQPRDPSLLMVHMQRADYNYFILRGEWKAKQAHHPSRAFEKNRTGPELTKFYDTYRIRGIVALPPTLAALGDPVSNWGSNTTFDILGMFAKTPSNGEPLVEVDQHPNATLAHFYVADGSRPLTPLQYACIRSFIAHGFDAIVWTAGMAATSTVAGLPPRARHADAAALVDAYGGAAAGGRLTVSADRLRDVLLHTMGGWWVQPRIVCLRPASDFVAQTRWRAFVMGNADQEGVCDDVVYLVHRNATTALGTPTGADKVRRSGVLIRQVLPNHAFYPVPQRHAARLFQRETKENVTATLSNSYAVSLWREQAMEPGSFAAEVLQKFGASQIAARPDKVQVQKRDSGEDGVHPNATTANFFWYRGPLNTMSFRCIQSFVPHGFRVVVWTYNASLVVPPGAVVGDASELLPEAFRLSITQANVRGSLSGFSNMIRYQLLETYGGWWFDTDIICMRHASEFVRLTRNRQLVVGFQDASMINGAVMYISNRSASRALYHRGMSVILQANGQSITWGMLGPRLITSFVKDLSLEGDCVAPGLFYPVPFPEWKTLFLKERAAEALALVSGAYTVHLWNELSKTTVPETGSFIAERLQMPGVAPASKSKQEPAAGGPPAPSQGTSPAVPSQRDGACDPKRLFCTVEECSRTQAPSIYSGARAIYVAHADPPRALLQLNSTVTQIYATVVGSMAGLNALLRITADDIIMYDINSWMVEFSKMYVELVKVHATRRAFLEAYFGRDLGAVLPQAERAVRKSPFLPVEAKLPVDERIVAATLARLPADLQCTYRHLIDTYMRQSLNASAQPQHRKCEVLSLFFDDRVSPKLYAGLSGPFEWGAKYKPNMCTFYYGSGWLASEASYTQVRTSLLSTNVWYATGDIGQFLDRVVSQGLSISGRSMSVYLSNIHYFLDKETFDRTLASYVEPKKLSFVTSVTMVSHDLGVRYDARACAGSAELEEGSPHLMAWRAVEAELQRVDFVGKKMTMLEIAHTTPWGFYEVGKARRNVRAAHFLKDPLSYDAHDVVVVHILVGEGMGNQTLADVLKGVARLKSWRMLLVMEHMCENTHAATTKANRCLYHWEVEKVLRATQHPQVSMSSCAARGAVGEKLRNVLFTVERQ